MTALLYFYIWIIIAFTLKQIQCLRVIKSSLQNSQVNNQFELYGSNDDNLYEDDSYSLLDLDKPVSEPQSLLNVYSIESKDDAPSAKITGNKKKKDLSLLKVDGDIDFQGDDAWLLEVRDLIEQRLGKAIWSNKSDAQLKAEFKRALALKAMRMPESVRKLIEEVFIEKTVKMKDYPAKNKLAVIEYRKWLMEQKQKQGNAKVKKSPLLAAKIDVSKRWLKRAPSMLSSGPSAKPPVVHDELTSPPNGYSVGSNAKPIAIAPANAFFQAAPMSIVTSSIMNWEKTKAEYLQTTRRFPSRVTSTVAASGTGSLPDGSVTQTQTQQQQELIVVDGEEMFIANNVDQKDYYVLL